MPSTPPSLWTPSSLTGVQCWLKADTGVTLNGSNVSQWNDQSGNNNHAVQATAGKQPAYYATDSRVGGRQAIGWNTWFADRGLDLPSFNAKEIYCVMAYSDGIDTTFDFFDAMFFGATKGMIGNSGTASIFSDSTNYANSSNVWENASATPSFTVLPMPASLLRFAGNTTQTWNIGYISTVANRTWNGIYCEWIFVDTALGTTDREKTEGYLAHRWGIQASLPSGHPYLSAPP
jgi:hypothetical protein